MAVARRIGNLTIHFLGDNAEQLAGMFDDAHSRSSTFERDMDETSRTHRNIYVGSALADLQDQPDFGNAGFNPESRGVKDKPAFGKAAGAETHFIVVKPGSHSLFHDRHSSAFRSRERATIKTGYCSCLRPGAADKSAAFIQAL